MSAHPHDDGEQPSPAASTVPGGDRGVSVLVVEDEYAIADLLRAVLVDEGYDVEIAENGLEALSLMRRRRPQAVLLDVMMPLLDGWGVCRAMRSEAGLAEVPVVMMSAAPPSSPPAGVSYEAFVSKPFDLDELLHTLAQLVAGKGDVSAA